MSARKWVLVKHFQGAPKDADLELQTEPLPALSDGDVLFEAMYLSVDPYMRPYSAGRPLNSIMIGEQLARVAESKHSGYKSGELYLAQFGWRDKTVTNPDKAKEMIRIFPAWNTGKHSQSLALGIVGMPGLSAYFGLLRICDPKPGETVFVNSAAGIVGSTVGQIAKIKGCRVIGCAGSDDKCRWLKSELGFDYVFNYKTADLGKALKEGAPNGIDCYFDNVGGDMTTTVILNHLNRYGRVACCGVLSMYNSTEQQNGPHIFWRLVANEIKVQGFIINSFLSDFPAAAAELLKWVDEGKLKVREDIVEGFENQRTAFYGMLDGKYTGKVVVKV